jgi:L-serine dehydratase
MKPVSVFDIFKIGIGPSSSHTVGPMLAAQHFALNIIAADFINISTVKVHLHGSLSLTGIGHGTDRAVLCGLQG